MTIKGCNSFVGMVNFVSIFCPEPQKLLKPIYDLTRKGRQFIWGQEQQTVFDDIKIDYRNLLSYTYQTRKEDSSPFQILANLPWVAHYIKFEMVSQNLVLIQ